MPTAKNYPLKLRCKIQRERAEILQAEFSVLEQHGEQNERRRLRFERKWKHIKVFYAKHIEPWQKRTTRSIQTLITLDEACRSSFTEFKVDIVHMEKVMATVYQLDLSRQTTHRQVRAVLSAYDRNGTGKIDIRSVICALNIYEKPFMTARDRLDYWFNTYATYNISSSLSQQDLKNLLSVPVDTDEERVQVEGLFKKIEKLFLLQKYTTLKQFHSYLETNIATTIESTIETLCWKKLLNEQRIRYYKTNYLQSRDQYEATDYTYRVQQAITYWRLMEPRMRFQRWKVYYLHRCKLNRCDKHAEDTRKRKGLRYLTKHACRGRWFKIREQRALEMCDFNINQRVFDAWIYLWTSEKELERMAKARAVHSFSKRILSATWQALVQFIEADRERKAQVKKLLAEFWFQADNKLLKKCVFEWRFETKRAADEQEAEKRQRKLALEFQESNTMYENIDLMSFEDMRSTAMRQDELDKIEAKRQEEMQKQTRAVYRRRQEKEQEKIRTLAKDQDEAKKKQLADTFWSDVAEKAKVETAKNAAKWLDTAEGKKELNRVSTFLYEEDPIDASLKLQNDPMDGNVLDCVWQVQLEDFGGKLAQAFYFNSQSYERIMCSELDKKSCQKIAREMIIQTKVNEMLENLQATAQVEAERRHVNLSATKIQMMFLIWKARKRVRAMMRALIVKRIDPVSGETMYFHLETRKSSRQAPYIMGSAENTLTIESTTWIRRIDEWGNPFYFNLETEETSWDPPLHYVMCKQCHINFVTRRCTDTGDRYCISCYAQGKHDKTLAETLKWTKIPVQASKCIVCKKAMADRVCHECGGDTLCLRCFTTLHQSAKLKSHTQYEIIGSQ